MIKAVPSLSNYSKHQEEPMQLILAINTSKNNNNKNSLMESQFNSVPFINKEIRNDNDDSNYYQKGKKDNVIFLTLIIC